MRFLVLAAFAALLPASFAFADYTVIDLTPSGSVNAQAFTVSGSVQAGASEVLGSSHAWVWNGVSSGIDFHPDTGGPDGSLIVGLSPTQGAGWATYSGIPRAGLWTFANPTPFQLLPDAGYLDSQANSVCGGNVVGVGTSVNGSRALLWRGGDTSPSELFPVSGYISSIAIKVSGDFVVGTALVDNDSEDPHAAVWDISGPTPVFTDIHPASGFVSSNAISFGGDQIVGYGLQEASVLDAQQHALLWNLAGTSFTDIHPVGYKTSFAASTNGVEIVGYVTDDNDVPHAMLWENPTTAMSLEQYLPAGDYVSSQAFSIDADGDIVGMAVDNDNNIHAILWSPVESVPEPASALLLVLPAIGLLVRGRRRDFTIQSQFDRRK
jgi:hypothetical protein